MKNFPECHFERHYGVDRVLLQALQASYHPISSCSIHNARDSTIALALRGETGRN